jgi:hypothetical protein
MDGIFADEFWAVAGYMDHKSDDHLCRFLNDVQAHKLRHLLRALAAKAGCAAACCHSAACVGSTPCELTKKNGGLLEAIVRYIEARGVPRRLKMISALELLVNDVLAVGFALRIRAA